MPELTFEVVGAAPMPMAASPHLVFQLRITDSDSPPLPIPAVALRCQIRIEPTRRRYDDGEKVGLLDLFGESARWGQTLRGLLWTHASLVVPSFTGSTVVDLPIPCTFDFNVAATKYFAALEDGEVPLQLLFSGTIFHATDEGALQAAPISWEKEADFRLPIRTWQEMMDLYYPNTAWLCLRKDVFHDLYEFKMPPGTANLGACPGTPPLPVREDGDAMNPALVDQIAHAVLYEGYLLYPYRPSVKNRQRWTFGGLYPRSYSEAQDGTDPWMSQTECLLQAGEKETASLGVRVRFLHLQTRRVERPDQAPAVEADHGNPSVWQEAVERELDVGAQPLAALVSRPRSLAFHYPSRCEEELLHGPEGQPAGTVIREQESISGSVEVGAEPVAEGLFKLSVRIFNTTPFETPTSSSRDEAQLRALVSTHAILVARGGGFVSSIDPPELWCESVAECRNIGVWPVLVGEPGDRDTMLSAPIILYDYPQIAPESPGDLFDATEIDEILTLRILTLTEDEKRAMSNIDERARALLERTESIAREQLMGLHGTIRGLRPL